MADAPTTLTLTLDSGGDVVIKLRSDVAPGHVERITTLARQGFYNGVKFHRVIPGFMAQGGCPMARSSNPDSANSQFFICFADASFLDRQYTVWGEVTSGMEFVDALPKGEPPRAPGSIVKATVA